MMEMKERIRSFIQENLLTFDDSLTLEDDVNIFEEGFVDSSFAMQLITFVEDAFHIEVTDDDLDLVNFSTINRLVAFVNRKGA